MDRGQEIELAASATVGSLNSLEGFDRTDMINMFGSGVTWADAHPKESEGCSSAIKKKLLPTGLKSVI